MQAFAANTSCPVPDMHAAAAAAVEGAQAQERLRLLAAGTGAVARDADRFRLAPALLPNVAGTFVQEQQVQQEGLPLQLRSVHAGLRPCNQASVRWWLNIAHVLCLLEGTHHPES